MLQSRIGSFEDLTILDLFAGSGACALEALSRGAGTAFLVEGAADARRAITENIRLLGADARLIGADATALPRADQAADIVFMDPPYGSGLYEKALRSILAQGWATPATWVALETAGKEEVSASGFTTVAARKSGKARLHLLRPVSNAGEGSDTV